MRVVLFVAALVSATPVFAQVVEGTINLSALGWGPLEMPKAIETDGDLNTSEWLVKSVTTGELRVVAIRNGGVCAGPWFTVFAHPLIHAEVQRVGLVHKMLVRDPLLGDTAPVTVVALTTPTCS